jgi:hypothetical protein
MNFTHFFTGILASISIAASALLSQPALPQQHFVPQPTIAATAASFPIATSNANTQPIAKARATSSAPKITPSTLAATTFATPPYVTQATLAAKLDELNNQLRSLIFANSAAAPVFTSPQIAAGGDGALFGSLAPPINQLSGTKLSNITVNGISGLTAADIPTNITASNYLPLSGGTITGALTVSTTTATSTISSTLAVLATSTLSGLQLSGANCTAFNNGGKLTTDASGNVVCGNDTSGSGSGTPGGSNTYVQFNDAGSFGGNASFSYDKVANRATLTFASTTAISTAYASSTNLFAGTLTLSAALSVPNGGTGLSTVSPAGVLVGTYAGSGYQQLATSSLGLLTTNVVEGSNLYYTLSRFAGALAGTTTDALAQGAANKYYSSLLFASDLAGTTTDALHEGAANLYFTNNRVAGVIAGTTTNALAEGSTNKYYTDARVGSYISGSSTVPHVGGSAYGDLLSWTGSTWATRATTTLGVALSDTTGTLAVNRGGTNLTSYTPNQLLYASGSGTIGQLATSSLGLLTTDVAEGSNLYWTNTRFDNRLAATTSLPNLTALANLASVGTITSGTWNGSILAVPYGGTGWSNITSGTVLLGNGTGALSTTSAGTNGQVLALVSGVPTWVATTSINNGVSSITQNGGGTAQTGALTFATSSLTTNGDTIGLAITNSGGTFTFAPNISGTRTVAGGGTGQTSFTSGNLLYGSGTNGVQNVATSSLTAGTALSLSGTAGALVGGTSLTINFQAPATSALSVPYASSTALTATALYSTNASTTNLNLSGIANALLKTVNGAVTAAVAGTDYLTAATTFSYPFPSNATSTLLSFNGGLTATNATSTNLFAQSLAASVAYFGGTATSSFSSTGVLTLGTALAVGSGGTGATTFGQGWLYSTGGTTALAASTSPTINYITATSTTATSTIGTGGFAIGSSQFVVQQGSGNVGIGTTGPGAKLDIQSSASRLVDYLRLSSTAANATKDGQRISFYDSPDAVVAGSIDHVKTGAGQYELRFNNWNGSTLAQDMTILTNGNVGIGNTNPGNLLTVGSASRASTIEVYGDGTNQAGVNGLTLHYTGDTHVANITQGTDDSIYFGYNAGSIATINHSTGTYSALSDQRLKKNIQTLAATSGLAAIEALNPVSFTFKSDSTNAPQMGFIAQQVQGVFPQLVGMLGTTTVLNADGSTTTISNTLGLNYTGLISPLVKAVQEIASISDAFKTNLIAWLGDASNGIQDLYASVVHSKEDDTQKLCVGTTCVTPAQFQAMVAAANQSPSNESSPSSQSGDASTALYTPPVIQINGDNPARINVGDTYNDLGATITGPQAGLNLGLKIFLNGQLTSNIVIDTSTVATDTIDYVATDSAGNTATSTRTVIITSTTQADTASTTLR